MTNSGKLILTLAFVLTAGSAFAQQGLDSGTGDVAPPIEASLDIQALDAAIDTYSNKLEHSIDRTERDIYTDSLMYFYGLRLECCADNDRADILKRKAYHYAALRPTDLKGIKVVFEEAIVANSADPDPYFINLYFKKLTDEYLLDAIEADEYIDIHHRLNVIMERIAGPESEEAKKTFDALFNQSKTANGSRVETYTDVPQSE